MSELRRLTRLGCVLAAAAAGLVSATGNGRAQAAADYLSAPGPVVIEGVAHQLAWSSHPSAGYYKHEYLPEGQKPERFERMALLELLASGATPESAASAKARDIKDRKARDPIANVALLRNEKNGEIIVDFVLGAPTDDGQGVVEWSAYRYVRHGDGVLMMGVSRRAYGADRVAFLKGLKAARPASIKALAEQPVPDVKVKG